MYFFISYYSVFKLESLLNPLHGVFLDLSLQNSKNGAFYVFHSINRPFKVTTDKKKKEKKKKKNKKTKNKKQTNKKTKQKTTKKKNNNKNKQTDFL